ncbi:MAG: RNA-protein complex protein Nop10 [Candidatus Diapherotrites archaeon]|nr:RNA-protein complex protein Nop10 [Candidatus Diapherotrites archaeon]
MKKLRQCLKCGEYTLDDSCPLCGVATSSPYAPKFSPEDRYGEYRRKAKGLKQ